MAEKKNTPSVGSGILGKNEEKLGTYKESYGGGTPLEAGEKAPSKAWVEANRVMQPRDENGRFTYNAANKKPLKFGPSRGTTIPPFLKGVKLTYAVENKSVLIGEDGKRYLAGISMTADEIIDSYKEYIGNGEEGGFKNLMAEMKKKSGAVSKKEKEAISSGYSGLFAGLNEEFKKEYVGTEISKLVKKPIKPFVKKTVKETVKPVETKNAETPVEAKKSPSADFDSNMAKNNPEQFVKDHVKEINDIKDVFKSLGVDVPTGAIVKAISNGDIKSVEHAKQLASEED